MKIKELNKIKLNLYNEFLKIEEVQELLKCNSILYIYEISEGSKHVVKCFTNENQVNDDFLKNNGFTKNAFVKKLYTIDKQTKQVF